MDLLSVQFHDKGGKAVPQVWRSNCGKFRAYCLETQLMNSLLIGRSYESGKLYLT